MSFEDGFDPGDFNQDGMVDWRDQSDQYYAANYGASNESDGESGSNSISGGSGIHSTGGRSGGHSTGSRSGGHSTGCCCLLFGFLVLLILVIIFA